MLHKTEVKHFKPSHSILMAVLSVGALASATQANARDFYVCKSGCLYANVQDAVDVAYPGDTVFIGNGVYQSPSIAEPHIVTLKGRGLSQTVLVGTINALCPTVTQPLRIHGVTITGGGSHDGGGINLRACSADLIIDESAVIGNHSIQNGGGIFMEGGKLVIRKSIITDNSTSLNDGPAGGLFDGANETFITDSFIANNTTGTVNAGGGIFCRGRLFIRNTTIAYNKGGDGGGIFSSCSSTLHESLIVGNTARRGGGIFNNSDMKLVDSVVIGNTATVIGGCIYNDAGSGGTVTLKRTEVTDNTPDNCVGTVCQ